MKGNCILWRFIHTIYLHYPKNSYLQKRPKMTFCQGRYMYNLEFLDMNITIIVLTEDLL